MKIRDNLEMIIERKEPEDRMRISGDELDNKMDDSPRSRNDPEWKAHFGAQSTSSVRGTRVPGEECKRLLCMLKSNLVRRRKCRQKKKSAHVESENLKFASEISKKSGIFLLTRLFFLSVFFCFCFC